MEITEELRASINAKAESLTIIKRPQRDYNFHMNRLGRYLAQIEVDKDDLVQSNFNWDNATIYGGIHTMINEIHAKRVAAEGKGSTPGEQFRALAKKMKMYRKVMTIVLEHVIKRNSSPSLKAAADKIKKGSTNIDAVRDVLALCEVLKDHLEEAKGITPRGILVNEDYLTVVSAEAEKTLDLEGPADNTGTERSKLVDMQKRLLMLSVHAIDDIKEYAKAAYFMDMDYYREHYTYSDDGKHESQGNTDYIDEMDDPEEMTEETSQE